MSPVYNFAAFVRCALALGFAIVCLVQAKKLGTGGALLMTGVAALDIATVLGWIITRVVSLRTGEALYMTMNVFGILFNLGSAGLVVVAMILWRKPPQL